MLANHTSRFHVATAAVRAAALRNEAVAVDAHKLEAQLKHMAEKERQYIYATGKGEFIAFVSGYKRDADCCWQIRMAYMRCPSSSKVYDE